MSTYTPITPWALDTTVAVTTAPSLSNIIIIIIIIDTIVYTLEKPKITIMKQGKSRHEPK